VNGTAENEVYRIKFATVADYEWNTSAYIPELSLWKALVKAYGPTCAKEVLLFNEAYYGLYQACMRVEGGEIGPEEAGRRGREWAGLMELRLALLRLLLPEGHRLPEELAEHLERQRARLEIYASGT
jgi:hypothetical protein